MRRPPALSRAPRRPGRACCRQRRRLAQPLAVEQPRPGRLLTSRPATRRRFGFQCQCERCASEEQLSAARPQLHTAVNSALVAVEQEAQPLLVQVAESPEAYAADEQLRGQVRRAQAARQAGAGCSRALAAGGSCWLTAGRCSAPRDADGRSQPQLGPAPDAAGRASRQPPTGPPLVSTCCALTTTDTRLSPCPQIDVAAARCEALLGEALELMERFGVPQKQRRWLAASLMPVYTFLFNFVRWV